MEIPVLIEPVAGNGYVARTGEPLPLRAEGATRDEAMKNLEQMVSRRLTNGSQFLTLRVPEEDNPWLAMAGMYDPNDPEVIAWKQAMAEYREKAEADPNYE
jgi:hypothetical protein